MRDTLVQQMEQALGGQSGADVGSAREPLLIQLLDPQRGEGHLP